MLFFYQTKTIIAVALPIRIITSQHNSKMDSLFCNSSIILIPTNKVTTTSNSSSRYSMLVIMN